MYRWERPASGPNNEGASGIHTSKSSEEALNLAPRFFETVEFDV
jgi:hypothetical protein